MLRVKPTAAGAAPAPSRGARAPGRGRRPRLTPPVWAVAAWGPPGVSPAGGGPAGTGGFSARPCRSRSFPASWLPPLRPRSGAARAGQVGHSGDELLHRALEHPSARSRDCWRSPAKPVPAPGCRSSSLPVPPGCVSGRTGSVWAQKCFETHRPPLPRRPCRGEALPA